MHSKVELISFSKKRWTKDTFTSLWGWGTQIPPWPELVWAGQSTGLGTDTSQCSPCCIFRQFDPICAFQNSCKHPAKLTDTFAVWQWLCDANIGCCLTFYITTFMQQFLRSVMHHATQTQPFHSVLHQAISEKINYATVYLQFASLQSVHLMQELTCGRAMAAHYLCSSKIDGNWWCLKNTQLWCLD